MRLLTIPAVLVAAAARRRRRPGSPAGRSTLIGAGLLVIALGLVGGERFESLGLGVHLLQHLLLGVAGPALIVGGTRPRARSTLGPRATVLLALACALLQPGVFLIAGSGLLETHAVLHLTLHAVLVASGLVLVRTVSTRRTAHPDPAELVGQVA